MDKKILIIGIVVLIVVIAGIYLLQEKPETAEPKKDYRKIRLNALRTKNSSMCYEIDVLSERNRCIYQVAGYAKNVSLCYEVEGTRDRNSCFWKVAESTLNASLCKLISSEDVDMESYKDALNICYGAVARGTENPEVCEEAPAGDIKDECYRHAALVLNNVSICDKIKDIPMFNICYTRFVERTENLGLCEFLKGGGGNPCYNETKPIYDLNDCKELCYLAAISELHNVSLCNTLSNTSIRNSCYEIYAINIMKNSTLCEKITDNDRKYRCIARITHNLTQCGFIEDEGKKSGCYGIIERSSGDPNICLQIMDEHYQDRCYSMLAWWNKDKELCNKIKDNDMRNRCKSRFGGGFPI